MAPTDVVGVGARALARVPLTLLRLPVLGIHRALLLSETLRRRYDGLAELGVALLSGRREQSRPRTDLVTRAAVAAERAEHVPTRDTGRTGLPIDDFDHLTPGSLRGRLRRLDLGELHTLRAYEQDHAARLPILTLLENRIAKLEVDPG